MTQYNGNYTDENGRPVQGASVYVYTSEGVTASITDADDNPVIQPLVTDSDGNFSYRAGDGIYQHHIWYGKRRVRIENAVYIGDILSPASAMSAMALANYRSTRAEGVADFVVGEFFSSGETGSLRLYKRVAAPPYYEDQGDAVAPINSADLAEAEGLDRLGWSFGPAAPFVQTRKALDALRDVGASLKDTGAVGDFATDDSDALQEIFDYFAERGGQWRIPAGVFKTTREIIVDSTEPQTIIGMGMRGVYPGPYVVDIDTQCSIIVPVHNDRNAFRFISPVHGKGTINLRNIALATLESGDVPTAAFGWETSDNFKRDFAFDCCSIHGFTSAFDTYKTGGVNAETGLFKAERCNINRNEWIARTLNGTQWNGFDFVANEAGQNGYASGGGLNVTAHCANILRNTLEGQRDPVKVSGSMRGIDVTGNYFEANVGVAPIHLNNIRGPYNVGPNAYLAIDLDLIDHGTVLLTNCGAGQVLAPYWSNGVYKAPVPVLGNSVAGDNILNPDADDPYLRMDSFEQGAFQRRPEYSAIARQQVIGTQEELAPWNSEIVSVEQYVSADPGRISLTYAIAGAVGDWAVVCWPFKRTPDAGAAEDPYISLSVNGDGDPGSYDYVLNAFDEYWRDGEWCLATCAIKLGAIMTSLDVGLYPHGIAPGAGRTTRYLRPVVYVVDDPNKIIPYAGRDPRPTITAPALSGAWVNGGDGMRAAGWWKDGYGIVHLVGGVKSGAGVIFTLPAGNRPAGTIWKQVYNIAGGSEVVIAITSDGGVQLISGDSGAVPLDDISFPAEN